MEVINSANHGPETGPTRDVILNTFPDLSPTLHRFKLVYGEWQETVRLYAHFAFIALAFFPFPFIAFFAAFIAFMRLFIAFGASSSTTAAFIAFMRFIAAILFKQLQRIRPPSEL